jgi:hypothetical protein
MDRTQAPTGVADGLLKAVERMDTEHPPRSTKVEVVLVVVEMPCVPVTHRTMQCFPRTGPSIHPFSFRWTSGTDDGMIALYLLGLPMGLIANKLVYGFATKQAQDCICNRLNVLKPRKEIPEKWQRAYHKSPKSTTHRKIHSRGGHRTTTTMARKWEVGNQRPDIRRGQSECSSHAQTRGLVVWTAQLVRERC